MGFFIAFSLGHKFRPILYMVRDNEGLIVWVWSIHMNWSHLIKVSGMPWMPSRLTSTFSCCYEHLNSIQKLRKKYITNNLYSNKKQVATSGIYSISKVTPVERWKKRKNKQGEFLERRKQTTSNGNSITENARSAHLLRK